MKLYDLCNIAAKFLHNLHNLTELRLPSVPHIAQMMP
jgi:hypothetical protein